MKRIILLIIIFLSGAYSDHNIIILNGDVANVLIRGNGEECKISMNSSGIVGKTTCLKITNSKGIKIFCTAKKKMCKTVSEIQNALMGTTSNQFGAGGLEALRQGMNYSEARQIILNSGWQGVNTRWQDIPESGQDHNIYYNNGWHEIVSCSGTGMGYCRFEFHDINQKKLVVITTGECSKEKCGEDEIGVDQWFFE